MFKFERHAELFLKVTDLDGQNYLFSKAGAWLATASGNCKFEKVLFGPNGNLGQQILGHIKRRLMGENLPLMRVQSSPNAVHYYGFEGDHIIILDLGQLHTLKVEAENILAFTDTVAYSATFIGSGIISQRGLFTSVLTANGPGAYVALLCKGNPLEITTPCRVDPDAIVAWTGDNPNIQFDVGWKNIIGQHSGESYQYEFRSSGQVVLVQPAERTSGIDIAIDSGERNVQQNQNIGGALGNIAGAVGVVNNLLNRGQNNNNNSYDDYYY